jgi:hypothetical protein
MSDVSCLNVPPTFCRSCGCGMCLKEPDRCECIRPRRPSSSHLDAAAAMPPIAGCPSPTAAQPGGTFDVACALRDWGRGAQDAALGGSTVLSPSPVELRGGGWAPTRAADAMSGVECAPAHPPPPPPVRPLPPPPPPIAKEAARTRTSAVVGRAAALRARGGGWRVAGVRCPAGLGIGGSWARTGRASMPPPDTCR